MNFKSLFSLFLLVLIACSVKAKPDSTKIKKARVIVVSSSLVAVLGGSYLYVENAWWSDKQIPFHFDDGADLTYALNVDKLGHFMGGLEAADFFSSSIKWAGMNEKKSLWYGAVFGSGLQLVIEMKDAYAPYWGFSKWDLALGSAGSFWPVAQYYNPDLKAINFKFSYYKRSNIYWDLDKQRGKETNKFAWQDDYPNQTYWVTFDVNHFIETCCWPDWLNVAVGFGIDDTQYLNGETKVGGNNEWYIALDYDVPKLLKKWNSPTGKKVKHWLNYFHFPAPTIRISPKLELYPLFL
ncbi:YfiM family protein [Flavobacteriales bacterium]|nr:YfiM family protein [Flavobacteriales bacterium]